MFTLSTAFCLRSQSYNFPTIWKTWQYIPIITTEPPITTEPVLSEAPVTTLPFVDIEPANSFRIIVSATVDAILAEAMPYSSEKKKLYTSQDFIGLIFERNPDVWCAEMDFTGCSPWNSYDGPRRAGTLVTPRHIIFSSHYAIPTNATIVFVTSANEVISRTVIATKLALNDVTVGLLDSDLPASIKPYKVLPKNYRNYIGSGSPVVVLDQEEKAIIAFDIGTLTNITLEGNLYLSCYAAPTSAVEIPWGEELISGDSGNPTFFYIDNELVLASVHFGPWYGVSIGKHFDTINSTIEQLGGGYTLMPKSLSAYPMILNID